MTNLSQFDPSGVSNPNNNIFGLPFTEEEARLVILPVPWEVTVSYGAGTSRSADHVFDAALQVDLYDPEMPDAWKQGFYMRKPDKNVLLKSDYLRKEAELYIDYISEGEEVEDNQFMCKTLVDVNEGGVFLNSWVFEQTKELLDSGKLVAILGGDHSAPLGYIRALAERYEEFGILQIDAHLDLREAYEGFIYSHASIMSNALTVPQLKTLVQVGTRDFSEDEWETLQNNPNRIVTFFDKDIKERIFEGATWKTIADEIVEALPENVYISFDVDGLDPKLCPNTGTPVHGGLQVEEVFYLLRKIHQSGRRIIGFDLCEMAAGDSTWDANVAARLLFKLCNLLVTSNSN